MQPTYAFSRSSQNTPCICVVASPALLKSVYVFNAHGCITNRQSWGIVVECLGQRPDSAIVLQDKCCVVFCVFCVVLVSLLLMLCCIIICINVVCVVPCSLFCLVLFQFVCVVFLCLFRISYLLRCCCTLCC